MKIPTHCSKCGRLIQRRIIRSDDNTKTFCCMECKERYAYFHGKVKA